MNLTKSLKIIGKALGWIALSVIAVAVLFLAFSGLERIASRILKSQANKLGLSEFRFERIKIGLDGRFEIEGIEASGRIDPASNVLDSIDASVESIAGKVNWWALLDSADGEAGSRSVVDFFPAMIEGIDLQDGDLGLHLDSEEEYVINEIDILLKRQGNQAIGFRASLGSAVRNAQQRKILTNNFAAEGSLSGPSLHLTTFKAETPWGNPDVTGSIGDLSALADEIRQTTWKFETKQWHESVPALSNQLEHFDSSEIDLYIDYSFPEAIRRRRLDKKTELILPQSLSAHLFSGGEGLRIDGKFKGGKLCSRWMCLSWTALPFELDCKGVLLNTTDFALQVQSATLSVSVPVSLQATVETYSPKIPFSFAASARDLGNLGDVYSILQSFSKAVETDWLETVMVNTGNLEFTATGRMSPMGINDASATVALGLETGIQAVAEPVAVRVVVQSILENDRLEVATSEMGIAGATAEAQMEGTFQNLQMDGWDGRFRITGFDPARFVPEDIPVDFEGLINASGTVSAASGWTTGLSVESEIAGRVAAATYEKTELGSLRIDGRTKWSDGALEVGRFSLSFGKSQVVAAGSVDSDKIVDASYTAQIHEDLLKTVESILETTSPLINRIHFGSSGSLSGEGNVQGPVSDPAFTARIKANEVGYENIRLSKLSAAANYQSPRLSIERLSAKALAGEAVEATPSLPASVSASGQIVFSTNPEIEFDARLSPLNLSLLNQWIPQTKPAGTVQLQVSGLYNQGIRRLNLDLMGESITLGQEAFKNVRLTARANEEVLDASFSAEGLSGCLIADATRRRGEPLMLRANASDFDLPAAVPVYGATTGSLDAKMYAELALPGSLADLFAVDPSSLLESSTASVSLRSASIARDGFLLSGVELDSSLSSGKLRANILSASPEIEATVDANVVSGSASITGHWSQVDFSSFLPSENEALQIVNSGRLNLSWSEGKRLTGEVSLEKGRLSAAERSLRQIEPARFKLDGQVLYLDRMAFQLEQEGGPVISVSGEIPLAMGKNNLDLYLWSSGIDTEIFKGVWEGLRDIDGDLFVDGRITGSLNGPTITGNLRLTDGRLSLRDMPQAFSALNIEATVDRQSLQVQKFNAMMGRGTIRGQGKIDLKSTEPPAIDAALNVDNIRYAAIEDLSVVATGKLQIQGALVSPSIIGEATILQGSFTRDFDWTQIVLTEFVKRQPKSSKSVSWNPTFDLDVSMPGDFWVRNGIASAELSAEGTLLGTLESPSFRGTAEVKRGVFTLNFGRFDIRRATALFEEDMSFAPFLLVEGETHQRGYAIRVHLRGRPPDLEMEWSASPPLSEQEIVNLLTTGSTERATAGQQSAAALWILSQGMRHTAETKASGWLPIGSVELQPVREGGEIKPELVTEQEITDRFSVKQYVGIEDPSAVGFGAEYEITNNLLLSGRSRQGNVYILELVFEILF